MYRMRRDPKRMRRWKRRKRVSRENHCPSPPQSNPSHTHSHTHTHHLSLSSFLFFFLSLPLLLREGEVKSKFHHVPLSLSLFLSLILHTLTQSRQSSHTPQVHFSLHHTHCSLSPPHTSKRATSTGKGDGTLLVHSLSLQMRRDREKRMSDRRETPQRPQRRNLM